MASVTMTRRREGILRRPTAMTGFWSWFTTIDHKKIGILYGATALVFFLVGGVEALLIRAQLAQPDSTLLNAEQYNQIFTMHGVTMIFLFVMPMSAAFFNYFIPLMIGARDVAFPRLNAFSYWVFLLGGLFLYSSFFLGGAPNGGWFCYAPNSTIDPSIGTTFYALGLIITGIASTAGAVNLAVTVINMRAPGMSLFRVPVFVWMGLVVQLLLAFSLPIITVALFQLLFDREFADELLRSDGGRGSDPVAAPVLAVRTSRGLHPDPPRVRHRLGGPAGLLAASPCSATSSSCSPGSRSGSSGSACGPTTCSRPDWGRWPTPPSASSTAIIAVPDRREDLQLDGHDVRWRHPLHVGDALRDRRRSRCS